MIKTMKRVAAFAMAVALVLSLGVGAFAAESGATGPSTVADATIDTTALGSISIYKYDMTQAEKDGAWTVADYVSTGEYDSVVNNALGNAVLPTTNSNTNYQGNGKATYGYAIQGVEFSYLKVADFRTYTENENGASQIILLYGIPANDALLTILGLGASDRYANADIAGQSVPMYYFTSDTLIDALENIMQETTRTAKKTALEQYMASHNATVMAETDAYGFTKASDLPLGLYLVVETAVPEMVTSTTAPFFVSVPMTAVEGGLKDANGNTSTRNADGGNRWVYDVTVYPKNETGIPSLEKTVREASIDTGKNNGTVSITDGYAHNATASDGDVVEYQIISTLPTITSEATELTMYTFVDTIAYGMEYNKDQGVLIEIFYDEACTMKVATWDGVASGKFTVTYKDAGYAEGDVVYSDVNKMVIAMTAAGLEEINAGTSAYAQTALNVGYSDWTMRITYSATLDSSVEMVYGDTGNDNDVTLEWQRSNMDYFDILVDDCHVYTYGIDLTKQFSDGQGDMSKVEFIIHNDTDDYYVQAVLNEAEGVYYVVDNADALTHACAEADATHFVPTADGKIIVKGLEDDTYTLTEVRTANGYTLLKDDIEVVISQVETADDCTVYTTDDIGVIQNDPRWANPDYRPFGQNALSHKLLTASGTVDANAITMLSDNGSANALVPLSVLNTRGFNLPQTGSYGNWMFPVLGLSAVLLAVGFIVIVARKKDEEGSEA